MGIISSIILGLIVGALAKWIMPGRDPGGIFITIGLGIVGKLLRGLDRLDDRFGSPVEVQLSKYYSLSGRRSDFAWRIPAT